MLLLSGGTALLAQYFSASGSLYAPEPPRYLTVQSGVVTPSVYFSTLGNYEIFRSPLTHSTVVGNTVTFHGYLNENDQRDQDDDQQTNSGMTVTSYGLVGGGATLASGSGTMFAVAPIAPFGKDAMTTVQYDFAVVVSGTQGESGAVLTSGGLRAILDYLAASRASDAPNPPLYVSVGAFNASIGTFQTSVPGWEIWREPIINRVVRTGTGALHSVTWSFLLENADANDLTLRTYGLVGGNATAVSGTGTTFFLFTAPGVPKTSAIMVSGNLTVTISGATVPW